MNRTKVHWFVIGGIRVAFRFEADFWAGTPPIQAVDVAGTAAKRSIMTIADSERSGKNRIPGYFSKRRLSE
jgi:hypothetical protein